MTLSEKSNLPGLHAAAVEAIDNVLKTPPEKRFAILDISERALVRLRDELIEQFRKEQDGQKKSALRDALEQVNVAVSLIVGVEFPGSGIQEKPIRQARDIIMETHV